jgi:hypothetical protein
MALDNEQIVRRAYRIAEGKDVAERTIIDILLTSR